MTLESRSRVATVGVLFAAAALMCAASAEAAGADGQSDAVVGQDLTAARIPGKVASVHWTIRTDHCTLQVVFPSAARIGPTPRRPDVQVWLLKADGTMIAPTRRLEPGLAPKDRRHPFGIEILFDYPLTAEREAVAAVIRVDEAFHIEPLTARR